MIQKIISGAQTGADRAGIYAEIEAGIPYGVWLLDRDFHLNAKLTPKNPGLNLFLLPTKSTD